MTIKHGLNVIEASAGTGKTFQLSFLFVQLYLQHQIPLEKLCAITFTRLATLELKQRIQEIFLHIRDELKYRLVSVASVPADKMVKPKLPSMMIEWLENTFENSEYEHLLEQCYFVLLNTHRVKITTIHSFFQNLLKRYYLYADIDADFDIIESEQWQNLSVIWAQEFWLEKQSSRIENQAEQRVFNRFFPTPESLFNEVPADSVGRAVAVDMSPPCWQETLAVIEKKPPHSRAKEYLRLKSQVKHYVKNEFLRFINIQADRLVQSGYLNHNLILEKTYIASTKQAFCTQVRQAIEAILIDEFQDTDYIQWSVIKTLFLPQDSAQSKHIICLIGDPKQSIYRFRSADIECYFQAIRQANYKTSLSLNWRSDKKILQVLNTIYRQSSLQPTPFEHVDLNYINVSSPEHKSEQNRLMIDRQDARKLNDNGVILRAPKAIERINKADSKKIMMQWLVQDCIQLCQLIKEKKVFIQGDEKAHKRNLEYSDILILCTDNTTISQLAEYLQQHGVPLSGELRSLIWQSEAAWRVISLLQSLSHHTHSHQCLFSAGDRYLIRLILGHESDSETDEDIKNFSVAFAQWQDNIATYGPLALWQKICHHQCLGSFHMAEIHLTHYLQEITNLFEKLQQWWQEGERRITGWLRRIQDQITLVEKHNAQENAIRMMTIHAAKGLEAPIVICPNLWDAINNQRPAFGDYLSYLPSQKHYTLTAEPLLQAKKIEAHRLLYVALTRAKSKLFLYWIPYKHRGEVISLESLFFSTLKEANKKSVDDRIHLEHLKTIPYLWVLEGDKKLLHSLITSNRYSTPEDISADPDDINVAMMRTRSHPQITTDLWSFTRLHQQNNTREQCHPKTQDENTRQPNATREHAPISEHKPCLSATQLGNLVHQLIEKTLSKDTLSDDTIPSIMVAESTELLKNLPINIQQYHEIQDQIITLASSTIKCTLPTTGHMQPLYAFWWHKYTEMRFDIKVKYWQMETLNQIINAYPQLPLSTFNSIVMENTRFYGFIDLVLIPKKNPKKRQTIWIVDYKTNFLGEKKEHYTPQKIHPIMIEHFYGWQGMFYALALYRWLQTLHGDEELTFEIKIAYLFSRGLALTQQNEDSSEHDDNNHDHYGKYFFDIPEKMLAEMNSLLS